MNAKNRYRHAVGICGVTLAILLLPIGAAHATPPTTATAGCSAAVDELQDTDEYRQIAGDEDLGGWFACAGSTVHLQPERDGEVLGELSLDRSSGELLDEVSFRVTDAPVMRAPTRNDVTAFADPDSLAGPPEATEKYRQIRSSYTETIGFHVIYGYNGDEFPKFTNAIKNTVNLNIGKRTIQDVSLSWTSMENRLIAPTTGISLRRENGRLPSTYVEAVYLGSARDENFAYRTSFTERSTLSPTEATNNYSVSVDGYTWYDQLGEPGGKYLELTGNIEKGHRWLCKANRVCEFPNGKEAPIL